MACKFCCSVKYCQRNKELKFLSVNGDEYRVKFTSNDHLDLILDIEWKSVSNVLVMAEVYTEDLRNCIASKGKVSKTNRTILTLFDVFNLCSSLEYDYKCFISVTPYEQFQSISGLTNFAFNPSVSATKWPVTEKRQEKLSLDMKSLLKRSDLSDAVVTDGTTQFKVHKIVLSARSRVFDKMFQHNLKENRQNRVTISDMSADALEQMIKYIYTGVITIKDLGMAEDLYVAADKYDIQDLRSACSSLIKNNIAFDSVLDILDFACLKEDSYLKKSAMEFIVGNYSAVKRHKTWDRFVEKNNTLVLEILSFVMDKRL